MTALTAMQQEWSTNSERKLQTGILLWDLSAAYDTLSPDILCEKLKIYGFDENSCKWFYSFLTGRTQRVKIGQIMSKQLKLVSGVPQGGILSPIIFIIYGADMEEWTKNSSIYTYADDTSTSCQNENEKNVIKMLEEDAEEILKFMASNELVANPAKTVFMMLNSKNKDSNITRKIKVGDHYVVESISSKLLGITIDNDQKWKSHVYGKNGLISSLNQRLFMIRRISNNIQNERLKLIVDGIWTSKLRYGLQLFSEVRLTELQPKNKVMCQIQKSQNKLMRIMSHVKTTDRKSIKDLLSETDMLSVNQTAAQIKLTEMWKVVNDPLYPIKMEIKETSENCIATRSMVRKDIKEVGKSNQSKKTFVGSAGRI